MRGDLLIFAAQYVFDILLQRTFKRFLRRPACILARMTITFRGVAETLLHETASRRPSLWGFERGDGARQGTAWLSDASGEKNRARDMAHRTDFHDFGAALWLRYAWRWARTRTT
jgi:hypothetical protein